MRASTSNLGENATVYIGTRFGNLFALNATSGEVVWANDTGDDIDSSPTVVNGTVYFGNRDNGVYAVNATSGAEVWRFETGGFVQSSPTVVNGSVYIGSDDANVYALDAETGEEVWRFETGDPVESSPTVVDGTVYVGSDDSNVYALDAETGEANWSFDTGNNVRSSPTVADGTVYVGTDVGGNSVYALDAETGEEVWQAQNVGSVSTSPTVVNETVYVGTDGGVYALDAETGKEIWRFDAFSQQSSPTIADGRVYFGGVDEPLVGSGYVYALDAETGEKVWRSDAGPSEVLSSPTVAGETVFVGSGNESVLALDAETGEEIWTANDVTVQQSSPTVVNEPANDKSIGSRVNLGTLGHHDVWAERASASGETAFSITVDTTAQGATGNQSFLVATGNSTFSYNYTVSWAPVDGEPATAGGNETGITGAYQVEFSEPGTYYVNITGQFPHLRYDTDAGNPQSDQPKIQTVEQWGTVPWRSFNGTFDGAVNLEYAAEDTPDLRNVTDTSRMFRNATSFNGSLGGWNTTSVTDMRFMFAGATSFTRNISSWCVEQIPSKPVGFDDGAGFEGQDERQPNWGKQCRSDVLVVDQTGEEGNFTEIQPAVDSAGDIDRIEVRAGTYEENVTIDKNVTVVTAEAAEVTGDSTFASGFTIPAGGGAAPTIAGFDVQGLPAVDAGDTDGDWTVRNVTVTGGDIIALGAGGNWTVERTEMMNDGNIRADDSTGDWRVTDTEIAGTGLRAENSTGDWRLRNVTTIGMPDTALRATESAGNWTLRNVSLDATDTGLVADDATGDWLVNGTSEITGASLAVSAKNTQGGWRIHRTNIVDTTDGIDATGADPRGNARRNWWGSFTGEDSADCVGNVSCANPLGEPARANATGFAVTLANELSTPLAGIEVYAYNLPEQDDDTLQLTLNEFDGQETVGDDQIPNGTVRETTTGPTGVARLTGLESAPFCLLFVPGEDQPEKVRTVCENTVAEQVQPVTETLEFGPFLTGLAEELSELRDRLSSAIDTRIRTAARGHDRTTDTLYGDNTRGFKEGVPDVILTAAEAKGTIEDISDSINTIQTSYQEAKKLRNPTREVLGAVAKNTTERAFDFAEFPDLNEFFERATQRAAARLWAAEINGSGSEQLLKYESELGSKEWVTNYTDFDSDPAVKDRLEALATTETARADLVAANETFEALRTGKRNESAETGGAPPDGFNRTLASSILTRMEEALAGNGLVSDFVITPQGNVYALNTTTRAYAELRSAQQSAQNAEGNKELSKFVSFVGDNIPGKVGRGVKLVGQTGETVFRTLEYQYELQLLDADKHTKVSTLRDVDNIANIATETVEWFIDQYESPTERFPQGELSGTPSFEDDQFGQPVVDANVMRPQDEGRYWDTVRVYQDTAQVTLTNTGENRTAARIAFIPQRFSYKSFNGGLELSSSVSVYPHPSEDPKQLDPGETWTQPIEYRLDNPTGDATRRHSLRTVAIMNGTIVDSALNETHVDVFRASDSGRTRSGPDGPLGYPRELADAADGAAVATQQGPGSPFRSVLETELGPGSDSAETTVDIGPNTTAVALTLRTKPGVDVSLQVSDEQGRVAGFNPATQRDEVTIPNATYTGSNATTEWVLIEDIRDESLTVRVNAALYAQVDPVPAEVVVSERVEQPAQLVLTGSPLEYLASSQETTNTEIRVGELGGTNSVSNISTALEALENGAGTTLPADTISVESGPATLGPGEQTDLNVSVDPPVLDIGLDEPTRFGGNLSIEGDEDGIFPREMSVFVLNTSVANASVQRVDDNVTGAHLTETTASDPPDGTVVTYDLRVLGNGTVRVTLPTTVDTEVGLARLTSSGWERVESLTSGSVISVSLPAGEHTLAVVEQTGPPTLPGFDNPPQDLDGDGLYEDVDGNDVFDILDVQALFDELDSEAVQSNSGAFNFNDDNNPGEVTIFDVQGLFNLVENRD